MLSFHSGSLKNSVQNAFHAGLNIKCNSSCYFILNCMYLGKCISFNSNFVKTRKYSSLSVYSISWIMYGKTNDIFFKYFKNGIIFSSILSYKMCLSTHPHILCAFVCVYLTACIIVFT